MLLHYLGIYPKVLRSKTPAPSTAVCSQWPEGRMVHSHHTQGTGTNQEVPKAITFMRRERMVGAQAGNAELVFMGAG